MKKKLIAFVFGMVLITGVLAPKVNIHAYASEGCSCYRGAGTHDYIVVQPTCTENGFKWTLCNNCNAVIETVTISKLGHKVGWHVLYGRYCERCGQDL